MRSYYIYIMSSPRGVLYTGVTNNIWFRVLNHKQQNIPGFTKKYNVNNLVYYEATPDISSAITREKQMKKWRRQWKIELIEKENSDWKDLYESIAV